MKTKAILTSIIVVAIISLLTTCKKYPENTIWFKSPESAIRANALNLKGFTVDGVDSLPMFDAIFNNPPYGGLPTPTAFIDVTKLIWYLPNRGGVSEINTNWGSGEYHFFNHNKELYIFYNNDDTPSGSPVFNFFYTRESNWKILKLTKQGELKIQRTYNNKVYEMHFNK
jgi:hypothetical protein